MRNIKSHLRHGVFAYSICVVLNSIALGHGGEKHDSGNAIEKENVDSLSSLQKAILDSTYRTIQSEFVTLAPIFKKGCFDCHSTKTEFPWYYKLPLVKGMIDNDVSEAKKHMDMSNGFPFGGHGKPADDLVAISKELVEGEMPPMSYRLMHWSAKPSDGERDSVIAWVERSLASLASIGVLPTESRDSTDSAE